MAWDDVKLSDGTLTASEWNAHVTHQKLFATGTASITAGNTSVIVTHALGTTPKVLVCPLNLEGTEFYVDTKGTTYFTIRIPVPQATTVSFDWFARG